MTRCESCHLPTTISKRRRELLQLVADGRWHDASDDDLERLDALDKDGLVWWVEYKPYSNEGGLYRITERGRELLEAVA